MRTHRWVTGFLGLLVALAVALVGLMAFANSQLGDAGAVPALASGDGVYLIVGSDSRANLPADLKGNFGNFEGARADVIILAQVADGRRQLLSIPRDLKVDIPGHGTNKINAAYAFGGPDLLVETVAVATGVRANHYVEVDFGGFAAIVDALGGIELHFPHPARDVKSGLDVAAGTQVVEGATALAYARSRSYEELRDGSWVSRDGGDIARAARQRQVLLEIVETAWSPSGAMRSPLVIRAVGAHLTTDSGLSLSRLLRTGWSMRSARETDTFVLPVKESNEGGVAYLVRSEPAATAMVEAFAAKLPLPEP